MAQNSAIQWTEATYNPWHGCIKVSAGCKNCYMYRDKERYGQDPRVVVRSKTTFKDPLKWKDGRMIFTCSWSDFFIEEADAWRDEVWDIIRRTPHHTYQILTKRPERIKDHLPSDWGEGYRNVWLGVSVEDQVTAELRIPQLLSVPASVHWLSAEPLLGPINLTLLVPQHNLWINALTGEWDSEIGYKGFGKLLWCVVGGESGPGARPMHPAWAKSLRDQCVSAEVAFFFKQRGEWSWCDGTNIEEDIRIMDIAMKRRPSSCQIESSALCFWNTGKHAAGRLLDGREWNEYPKIKEENIPSAPL